MTIIQSILRMAGVASRAPANQQFIMQAVAYAALAFVARSPRDPGRAPNAEAVLVHAQTALDATDWQSACRARDLAYARAYRSGVGEHILGDIPYGLGELHDFIVERLDRTEVSPARYDDAEGLDREYQAGMDSVEALVASTPGPGGEPARERARLRSHRAAGGRVS